MKNKPTRKVIKIKTSVIRSIKMKHQLISFLLICNCITQTLFAQSIGYQPNFHPFGFNPYMSPVYGYGLGLGSSYGSSYGLNALKNPWLLSGSASGSNWYPQTPSSSSNFASKFHAKSILKKLGSTSYDPYNSYNFNYGYGKHYGAAQLPNNPYKSTYGDYYSSSAAAVASGSDPLTSTSLKSSSYSQTNPYNSAATSYDPSYSSAPLDAYEQPQHDFSMMNSHKHALIKPLLKAGAILTTAAILGKKKYELIPHKLNPTGMILGSI